MSKSTLLLFSGILLAGSLSAQTVSDTLLYTGSIVTYTVTGCAGNITIETRGAQGGNNASSSVASGLGAIMIGDFTLTPGTQLKVLVGQNNQTGNGGGGGTFVTDVSNNPLIVAGGGGGSSGGSDSPAKHGQVGTSGGNGSGGGGAGGTAGSGGFVGASFASGAGAGLLTDGQDGWTPNSGGDAFVNGGAGANVGFGIGGFGGGGNGSGYVVGGGGGGYSGGGSGSNSVGGGGNGGGGGSFNSGTNQVNTGGANSGNGMVIITYTLGPSAPSSVTGSTTVCYGDTLTLTAATVPGAITYNWSLPGSATVISGAGTNVISIVHNAAGTDTASVTVTSACGTSLPATFTYTVNPQPTITLSYSPLNPCDGDTVTITASGALSYVWTTGGTNPTETFVINGNMTVTAISTDSNGCTSMDGQGIGANPNPVVALGADTAVCGNLVLDAQNSGASFMWSDMSTAQTLSVNTSGAYDVLVTDGNGCIDRDTINVSVGGNFNVVGSAAMNFVCTGEPTVMLFDSPSGGVWTGPGVFGNTFEPDTAGVGLHTLTYTYTDSIGCSGTDTVTINVDLCLAVNAASSLQTPISIYPNPNNGAFAITFANAASGVVIEITDVQGRVVYTSNESTVNAGSTMQIDLSSEANGTYLVRVTTDESVTTNRVILQH